MRFAIAVAGALALAGCGHSAPQVPAQDGNYVQFLAGGKARLVVKAHDNEFSVTGSYVTKSDIPAAGGKLGPSSVERIYNVTTSKCGSFTFALNKVSRLVLVSHVAAPQENSGSCPFTNRAVPTLWTALGL